MPQNDTDKPVSRSARFAGNIDAEHGSIVFIPELQGYPCVHTQNKKHPRPSTLNAASCGKRLVLPMSSPALVSPPFGYPLHREQQEQGHKYAGELVLFSPTLSLAACCLLSCNPSLRRRPQTHHGISPAQAASGNESRGIKDSSPVVTMRDEAARSKLSEGRPTTAAHPRAEGLGVVYTDVEEGGGRRPKLSEVPGTRPIGRALKDTASLPAGGVCEGFGEDGNGMGRGREGGERAKGTTRRPRQVSLPTIACLLLHEGRRFDKASWYVVLVRRFGKAFWYGVLVRRL